GVRRGGGGGRGGGGVGGGRGVGVEGVPEGLQVGGRRGPRRGAGAEEISRLDLRGAEDRRGQPREDVVRGAELGAARQQVVVKAGEGAQSERKLPVRDEVNEGRTGRVQFRDPDLLENEFEV